jgi:uncharacterized phage protein (TIGR02218 family)
MSRTVSAGMATMLASRFHTRCRMMALVLTDGTKLGFTDHDQDLTYTLSADAVGELTFQAGEGIISSDIQMSCGLEASNMEVSGPIGSVVTMDALLGGRFDDATVYVFDVDHTNLANGEIAYMKGNVTEVRLEGGEFVLEIRDQKAGYERTVCRVMTNQCPWEFADGVRCHATATIISGTVLAVTSEMEFTVSYSGTYADDFFNKGLVTATSGALLDTLPVEIEDWNETTAGQAVVKLYVPLVEAPAVGDTFDIKDGCSKLRKSDDATVPTCVTHGAILDFGGFPEMPGSDKVLPPAIPTDAQDGSKGGK